jgi:hypothetical protein
MNSRLRILIITTVIAISSCDKLKSTSVAPLTSSKDFWIDRCEIKYQGKDFPLRGSISDMVQLFGPYDRYAERVNGYFWDGIGLEINTLPSSDRVRSVNINFNRLESVSEEVLRLSGTPDAMRELAEEQSNFSKGFFHGELVMEGAMIGNTVDFSKTNTIREEYFKTQTGVDAHVIAIQQSWSSTRYAFERVCADGKHVGFLFMLLSGEDVAPNQMRALIIDSNNVPDSSVTHDVNRREE